MSEGVDSFVTVCTVNRAVTQFQDRELGLSGHVPPTPRPSWNFCRVQIHQTQKGNLGSSISAGGRVWTPC